MIIIQGCVKVKIPPDAIIAEEKFIRYLLVKRDYDDKSDYLKTAGFTLANYKNLIDEIRKLISKIEAIEERTDEYGIFYKVTGNLTGAEGVIIKVATVWLKRKVDGLFQFVTLIPGKRR